MERYNEIVPLKNTYTVDKKLLQSIEKYINNKVPGFVGIRLDGSDPAQRKLCSYSTTSIHTNSGMSGYNSIEDYDHDIFSDGTERIEFLLAYEIKQDNSEPRLTIGLRLGKKKEPNDLTVAIWGQSPQSKVIAIKYELLEILDRKRNMNKWIYPNEIISSALMALIVIAVLLLFIVPVGRYTLYLSTLLGILLIYLFGLKYLKGYCVFDTNRQKRNDAFFNWFLVGIAGSILAFSLDSLRKLIFGV